MPLFLDFFGKFYNLGALPEVGGNCDIIPPIIIKGMKYDFSYAR